MNWELVAQIAIIVVVVVFAIILLFCVIDVALKNKHERNLELRKFEHDQNMLLQSSRKDA